MSFTTFGDLASSFQSRQLNAMLKQDLTRLGQELSTGRKQDLASAVSHDFGPIAGIEHALKVATAHKQATGEAKLLLATTQITLENIQSQAQELSSGLIIAVSSNSRTLIETTAMDAREKFRAIVSNLNADAGGRSLFAGAATDGQALIDADEMLAQIGAAIAGETTASGVSSEIDNWFLTAGAGFEVQAYLGSVNKLGPMRLGNGMQVELPAKADDPELRQMLAALAKSAVLAEGSFAGDVTEQCALTEIASTDVISAVDQLILLRAHVGTIEARVENAAAQNAAEQSALELARNELTAADPYETATALEGLYGQMEALYTVTARLSKLNFTDYMR